MVARSAWLCDVGVLVVYPVAMLLMAKAAIVVDNITATEALEATAQA
jgi:hypothetical protein